MSKKIFINKKLLFLSFLILYFALFDTKAQHQFGIKLYGGFTKMRYISNSSIILNSIDLEIKEPIILKPNGGLYYNYQLNNNILLGFEILYSQMQYVKNISMSYINSTDYIHIDNIINFSYFGLPFYVGRNSEKLTACIGLMPLFLIQDNWRSKGVSNINDTLSYNDEKYKQNIDKFDIGIRVGFVYKIYKRLYIESDYYWGINNLFIKDDKDTKGQNLYNQQLTIGIRYDLYK